MCLNEHIFEVDDNVWLHVKCLLPKNHEGDHFNILRKLWWRRNYEQ